ncbi:MAG TPA: GNAT family N-acetyltransferase [Candidatus Dormibacteraeota bacterium]|nr:GNAT family N-acetyltransferase [Candidatus Dormibacteraeota bacterium]
MTARLSIRQLEGMPELHELAHLFATIWGRPGEPPMDTSTLRALSHSGNYVAGAYAQDRMIGGLIGWLGGLPDDLHLHSHILGVLPDTEARGVGFALKQDQRAWCLDRDVSSVMWTFDPLVRRNAYFNLVKLGADAVEYLVDFYGAMDDGINTGDESDRLLIRWNLRSEKAIAAAEGRAYEPPAEPGAVRVPVPEDIVAIRRRDPALARRWRHQVREALGGAMSRGHRVTGFTRDFEYVLSPD